MKYLFCEGGKLIKICRFNFHMTFDDHRENTLDHINISHSKHSTEHTTYFTFCSSIGFPWKYDIKACMKISWKITQLEKEKPKKKKKASKVFSMVVRVSTVKKRLLIRCSYVHVMYTDNMDLLRLEPLCIFPFY